MADQDSVTSQKKKTNTKKGHSGDRSPGDDLSDQLISARVALGGIFAQHLTLSATDDWQSQARFAPGGQAVVWGQSGLGPHAKDEHHFIPSIEPYCNVLEEHARRTVREM